MSRITVRRFPGDLASGKEFTHLSRDAQQIEQTGCRLGGVELIYFSPAFGVKARGCGELAPFLST